jgi:hypothetical protein
LLKPAPHTITGKTLVCNSTPTQTYSTQSGLARYYHWEVTGGTLVNYNPLSPTVTVIWDTQATVRNIKLTPYSKWDAKGDTVLLTVEMSAAFQNQWSAGTGLWNVATNWTMGVLPESCHHVIIPNQSAPIEVTIPQGNIFYIKSISVGNNVKLIIKNPASLVVQD